MKDVFILVEVNDDLRLNLISGSQLMNTFEKCRKIAIIKNLQNHYDNNEILSVISTDNDFEDFEAASIIEAEQMLNEIVDNKRLEI